MTPLPAKIPGLFLVGALFTAGCSDDGGSSNENTGGTAGAATGGSAPTGGTSGTATGGSGGSAGVPTPEGELFMDDFESGATKWDVTQGTCSIVADDTNVFTCLNEGMEARAVAGEVWGEYSVQARVRVNMMDPGRRIYLAGRFTDSNNWYGAAIYNDNPFSIQIRKKVGGTSSDIASLSYPIALDTWYTLKLEMKGSTLRMFVDDTLQIETTDTQFASGRVALLVDRSNISWDDVLVTNP